MNSRRSSIQFVTCPRNSYTYTTQGDLLTLASTLTGTSNTYTNTFTKAHQLASESASNVAWAHVPATFQTTAYSAANNLNQYVTITVGANPAVTMAYDANGNLTGDGVWTFAYDAQNMLRSAVKSGGAASYDYDPLGRRQMLSENGTTTTFLHDGDEEIADYASTTVLRRYVPGPGTDMPIAMVTPSGGSNVRKYFHTNRQGSTVAMSADSGTIAESPYTYDAYGNGAPTTGVPFKYTGRRLDPGTGLYYYRARYYSAALGRFLQVDPVGYADQMNLYGYASNDPTNVSDPTGLAGCPNINTIGGQPFSCDGPPSSGQPISANGEKRRPDEVTLESDHELFLVDPQGLRLGGDPQCFDQNDRRCHIPPTQAEPLDRVGSGVGLGRLEQGEERGTIPKPGRVCDLIQTINRRSVPIGTGSHLPVENTGGTLTAVLSKNRSRLSITRSLGWKLNVTERFDDDTGCRE